MIKMEIVKFKKLNKINYIFYSVGCVKMAIVCRNTLPKSKTDYCTINKWAGIRTGWFGNRIPVGTRFPVTTHTCPWAHPGSCAIGTGSLSRG